MKYLKKLIRKTLLLLAKSSILFESVPDFSDNTMPVYQEFIRRGYNKRYYLLWIDKSDHIVELRKDTKVIELGKKHFSVFSKMKLYSAYDKTIVKIFCNRIQPKQNTSQALFYLSHGTPIKDCHRYYTLPETVDYCFATSEYTVPMMSFALQFPENKIIPLGYPRNDILCNQKRLEMKTLFGDYDCFIVWYPTFRQKNWDKNINGSEFAIPVIHDERAALKLNYCASKNNVLIIAKPHFAQDISYITDLGLKNICFISDQFLNEHNITSYELIASSDALLSDYSSIYYDYLLCDKPIGLIWEDIENYKNNPGLIENYEYYCQGAEIIYSISDLCGFVENVSHGIDYLFDKRNKMCSLMNYSRDGKSTERVVDYIIKKAKL